MRSRAEIVELENRIIGGLNQAFLTQMVFDSSLRLSFGSMKAKAAGAPLRPAGNRKPFVSATEGGASATA